MKTQFNMPVSQLIQFRHSVRNYKDEPLSHELISQIETYISTVENPFNKKIMIKLITKSRQTDGIKLGTYGFISGANHFLVTACEDDEISLMALGYSLEKVILYCTSLGLGTVWLGGTFSKSNFAKAIVLSEGQVLPIVAPVGYEGGKKTFIGRLIGSNAPKRKDFSELFFNNSFTTPLTHKQAGHFAQPLEMLRLAPSAVNLQPWRAIKIGDTIHFYLNSMKGLTKIDLGIGLCHFDLTAQELGLKGTFYIEKNEPIAHQTGYIYRISWTLN